MEVQRNRPTSEDAWVIFVDENKLLCNIMTESGRNFSEVEWLSGYGHPYGYGELFLPEEGTRVRIVYPDIGDRPYIVGWARPEAAQLGSTIALRPGDWMRRTRNGAYLRLLRSGLCQILATPNCHFSLIPFENLIRAVSEEFEQYTAAGSHVSRYNRDTNTTDDIWQFKDHILGDPKVQIHSGYVEDGSRHRIFYQDPDTGHKAQMRFGTLLDKPEADGGKPTGTIFDLNIDDQVSMEFGEDEENSTLWRMNATKDDRTIALAYGKDDTTGAMLTTDIKDRKAKVNIQIGDLDGGHVVALDVNGQTTLKIGADGTVDLETQKHIHAKTKELHLDCPDIRLGTGHPNDAVVTERRMQVAFNSHIHPTGVGPSGPPAQPIRPKQISTRQAVAS